MIVCVNPRSEDYDETVVSIYSLVICNPAIILSINEIVLVFMLPLL